ncbi:hypothetical protein [Sphingomonas sp. PB1R3]
MIQDPEQTSPDPVPNEDDTDSSGAGYGNHGEAGDEETPSH